MKVLLSIKPEFADKIFNGTKKYEFRRSIFKKKEVKTVVVYASSPVQKIIGEFEIETIIKEKVNRLWNLTKDFSGISEEYFFEYFINKAKYHWIMNTCICRESMSCKNYPINLGCLFLGEAVLGINPKLGRLVSKQEALEHVKKCRDAGLIHMIGKNKLDMQWLGVKPGEKLLTICNCDPCCCLWRILPFVSRDIGSKVKKMDGVYVKVNQNCVGCGICTTGVCFVDAIHLHGNIAKINENSRGCGRCVEICPQNAIELSVMDNEFIKKSIKKIEKVIKLT